MPQCRQLAFHLLLLLVTVFITAALAETADVPQPAGNIPPPPKWPTEFVKDGTRLIIYQPQLRSWHKFRDLTCDTAISITPSGRKPVLGVVSWRADTIADTEARIVLIRNIVLTGARFPSLDPAGSADMERLVRGTYPASGMTIGLDRLLAAVRTPQEGMRTVALSTDPPQIFVSTSPAILLFVDGEAVRAPIEGTNLEYVVNTNWDLFYDRSDYYLLTETTWLKAKGLQGPWQPTTQLPAAMSNLPAGQAWDDVRKAIPPSPAAKPAPRIFFVQKPAELLVFKGQPVFKGIPQTHLAYASNTENDVFRHSPDQLIYILISGRWFRAPGLQGPWGFAGNDLSADFAKIPATHPRAHVLASVPGAQAAQDAVLLAQVPTAAIVNRAEAEANVKVVYAGNPQFKPIEGTSLAYASNTQEKVIKYGDLYYLCFQGVWFMSTSANGPWKTADSVPKAIYEIPPSSPVYNVTYVTVTNPTPTTVESSYTSGYVGMFVMGAAVGASIAYGTGYYYQPYYYWGAYPYPIYYPYPYTYGYRAVYNPTTGFYGVGGAVYGPYGAAGRAAWYNPSTGTYGRAASVQTAYGGRTVAQAYNPWTGTYAATSQGHNAYSQWGSSVVQRGDDWARTGHVTTDKGTIAGYKTSEGGSGRIVHGADGTAGIVKTADNNIYAGKDGNVYKRDSNGNWSKYDNGNWNPVEKHSTGYGPTTGTQPNTRQPFDQQRTTGGSSAGLEQQRTQPAGAGRDSATPNVQQPRAPASAQRPQTTFEPTAGRSSVSPDTMRNLNRDAVARQQGAWREQGRGRWSGGGARIGRGR